MTEQATLATDALADLALDDATVGGQLETAAPVQPPADPWLARRALGWGASDVPALLIALGARPADGAPRYIADRARVLRQTRGYPRLIAEKALLVAPYATGRAATRGTARERELLAHWRTLLEHGQYYCDDERDVVPESVTHADALLRCAWPLVDRHCPPLTCTLDAWARDTWGCELVAELKCSATERRELPWYWRDQLQAQLAVTGADYGLLVCGEYWSADYGHDGPVRVWPVQRDEDAIDEIRSAARVGWCMVEEARDGRRDGES